MYILNKLRYYISIIYINPFLILFIYFSKIKVLPHECGSVVEHQPKNQEVTGLIPGEGNAQVAGLIASRSLASMFHSHQCFYLP